MAEATVNIKVSWREVNLILKALQIASRAEIAGRYDFSQLEKQLMNKKEK